MIRFLQTIITFESLSQVISLNLGRNWRTLCVCILIDNRSPISHRSILFTLEVHHRNYALHFMWGRDIEQVMRDIQYWNSTTLQFNNFMWIYDNMKVLMLSPTIFLPSSSFKAFSFSPAIIVFAISSRKWNTSSGQWVTEHQELKTSMKHNYYYYFVLKNWYDSSHLLSWKSGNTIHCVITVLL